MTIFEDKSILKKRLKNRYNLSSKDVKYLMKKRYKGWSRLSRKLIDGLCTDNRYGSNCTILDVMKESNMTLMEIINNDELGYKKLIEERSFQNKDEKFKYDEVNELAGSPAIKRGIWQSLKIVEEITKYMKHKPTHIYIEFAREEGKKKRTNSQVKVLKNIYDNLSKDKKLAEEHDEKVYQYLKKEDVLSHISNERLYLYYTQMGKCMYSQKELDIDKLHLYEVDHIVPRSLIKDDSIDNKVLVIKDENQRKSNDPSLSSRIIDKQSSFWKFLLDNKLITPKKYFNLMRREYDEKTTEKFINRQIVETRQIIKNVAQIISEHYSTTKVVTVRANLTHQFREKYHIYKNRNVNDYHHAHDAYIACIIGDYIQKCYPKLESKYIYGEYLIVYKKDKKKQFNDGFILNGMRNDRFDLDTGERVWDASQIPNIIKCFDYKDCFITKKLEDNDSALFKVTIVPGNKNSNKGKTEASIPVNKYRSNIEKYGGYTGIEYEILAIEGMKKKKKIRKLVGLPLAYRSYSKDEQVKYIENNEKLTNVKIIKTIKKNQLIEYNGGLFFITSYQELVNAKQLILSHHDMGTIYMINKAITSNDYSSLNQSDVVSVYEIWLNKLEKLYPLYNSIVDLLKSLKDNFEKLTLEQQCAIIMELLKITQANPASNNKIKFDKFTMPERKSRLNGKTINLDGITFINQSVTGIYEKKVKL
jgi:CRISPR-associated endonuclease Csn1